MAGNQPRYLSCLLRLWQTDDDGEQIWRASLESPGSGERQGFASLEALFEFLRAQTASQDELIAVLHVARGRVVPPPRPGEKG